MTIDKAFIAISQLQVAMHGAIVISADDGTRLDNLGNRGVRVSHMEVSNTEPVITTFERNEISNFHVREAVVLAGKVLSCPGVIGELCWSDDPDYVVGYVAGNGEYHRTTKMKEKHSPMGGRVFFVSPETDMNKLKEYLEKNNVLVNC